MRTVCVCVRVRVCVWLYNCVLLQNTRGMSDDNDVCVWLYNCVFYMYVCLGVVFLLLFFIDLYLKSN